MRSLIGSSRETTRPIWTAPGVPGRGYLADQAQYPVCSIGLRGQDGNAIYISY